MKSRLLLLVAAAMLLVTACNEEPAGPLTSDPSGGDATLSKADGSVDLKDRYIVVFRESVEDIDAATEQLMRGNSGKVHFRYRHAIKGFSATIPAQALEGMRRNPNVESIEPDGLVYKDLTQTNPPSWGLDRIDQRQLPLSNSYSYQNEGEGVDVYIIDTGIRFDHQEYYGRAVSGYDFVDNDNNAYDCDGHGTHVAGTVGGTTVGVAKKVKLIAVRVLDCNGSGTWSGVIAGIDWVTANANLPANANTPAVANMSLGGGYFSLINTAVENSIASGVVYAVSAGNSNANACNYSPASAPNALTVGSTTSSDSRSSFSNYGTCVDVFAPGSNIRSSTMTTTSSYANWSGTSMASPHVAGVAALYLASNPSATVTQVNAAIINGATTGVVSNPGTGSPNRLLYNQIAGAPVTPTVPADPTSLGYSSLTSSSVVLTWTDNAGDENGFRIERSTNSGSTWTTAGTVGASITTFTDNGLAASTPYSMRVIAFNGAGDSGPSNTVAFTTPATPPPPSVINMWVSDITASTTAVRNNWYAEFTVTIVDASNTPVAGATVTGAFGLNASGTASAVTNSSGQCTVTTSRLNKHASQASFTVTNVVASGYQYVSANNVKTTESIVKP
jgi:subtilisin family serine protease